MADREIVQKKDGGGTFADLAVPAALSFCAVSFLLTQPGCAGKHQSATNEVESPLAVSSVLADKSLVGKVVSVSGNAQFVSVGSYSRFESAPSVPVETHDFTYYLNNPEKKGEHLRLYTLSRLPEGPVTVMGKVALEDGLPVIDAGIRKN